MTIKEFCDGTKTENVKLYQEITRVVLQVSFQENNATVINKIFNELPDKYKEQFRQLVKERYYKYQSAQKRQARKGVFSEQTIQHQRTSAIHPEVS